MRRITKAALFGIGFASAIFGLGDADDEAEELIDPFASEDLDAPVLFRRDQAGAHFREMAHMAGMLYDSLRFAGLPERVAEDGVIDWLQFVFSLDVDEEWIDDDDEGDGDGDLPLVFPQDPDQGGSTA